MNVVTKELNKLLETELSELETCGLKDIKSSFNTLYIFSKKSKEKLFIINEDFVNKIIENEELFVKENVLKKLLDEYKTIIVKTHNSLKYKKEILKENVLKIDTYLKTFSETFEDRKSDFLKNLKEKMDENELFDLLSVEILNNNNFFEMFKHYYNHKYKKTGLTINKMFELLDDSFFENDQNIEKILEIDNSFVNVFPEKYQTKEYLIRYITIKATVFDVLSTEQQKDPVFKKTNLETLLYDYKNLNDDDKKTYAYIYNSKEFLIKQLSTYVRALQWFNPELYQDEDELVDILDKGSVFPSSFKVEPLSNYINNKSLFIKCFQNFKEYKYAYSYYKEVISEELKQDEDIIKNVIEYSLRFSVEIMLPSTFKIESYQELQKIFSIYTKINTGKALLFLGENLKNVKDYLIENQESLNKIKKNFFTLDLENFGEELFFLIRRMEEEKLLDKEFLSELFFKLKISGIDEEESNLLFITRTFLKNK